MKALHVLGVVCIALAAPSVAAPVTYSGTGQLLSVGTSPTWQLTDPVNWSFTIDNAQITPGGTTYDITDASVTIGSQSWLFSDFVPFLTPAPGAATTLSGLEFFFSAINGVGTPLITGVNLFGAFAPQYFIVGEPGNGYSGPTNLGSLNAGTVAGVPEPSNWAMLIAGFGLIGAVARKRRLAVA